MSITFNTTQPTTLLAMFTAAIEQTDLKGKITTWERTADGLYYTHRAPEWHKKAFLKPRTQSNQLTFNIIKPQNMNVSRVVYGYYHGHLIETFLNHFDQSFGQGIATALPDGGDNCGT
jgi:hypothetical protein